MDTSIVSLLLSFVDSGLISMIIACVLLGWLLKQIPWFKNQLIPVTLVCFSLICSAIYLATKMDLSRRSGILTYILTVVIQGIIAGAIATGLHQNIKQLSDLFKPSSGGLSAEATALVKAVSEAETKEPIVSSDNSPKSNDPVAAGQTQDPSSKS